VRARSGDWVDAIAPLCANWDAREQAFLPPGVGPMRGGGGGAISELACDRTSAVSSFQIEIVPSGHHNVASLAVTCQSVRNLRSTGWQTFGTTVADRDARAGGFGTTHNVQPGLGRWLQCHDGDFAVGIYGGYGAYVDRIGLICAPRPLVTSPVTRRADAPIAPAQPPSRVVITPDVRITPAPPPREVTAGANLRVTPERQRPRPCIEGYTWRAARAPDFVCVTLRSHDEAQAENAAAASRVDPNGAWGPSSCVTGYVWREAWDGDVVCVTPARRDQVREENRVAANFQVP
jgi:hypothetical protein